MHAYRLRCSECGASGFNRRSHPDHHLTTSNHVGRVQVAPRPRRGRRTERRSGPPLTYFARAVAGGPIKIGQSKDPNRRVQHISSELGRRVEVLAVTASMTEWEAHQRFLAHALPHARVSKYQPVKHSEWFEPVPELLELIDQLAKSAAPA